VAGVVSGQINHKLQEMDKEKEDDENEEENEEEDWDIWGKSTRSIIDSSRLLMMQGIAPC
jgi:hypothetical protein